LPSWLRVPDNCPAALSLIGITVLLFIAQLATNGAVTIQGLLFGPAVQHGQWWRLITSGFLHGNVIHIGFNMYLLFVLGPQLERLYGSLRFLLIYLGALLFGSLAVMLFDWNQSTLGASGAVLGLGGALGIVLWERGINPRHSPVFGLVVLNLALPLLVPGISFWGHFGGIVGGALMAYILVWRPNRQANSSAANLHLTGSAAVLAIAALAYTAAQLGGVTSLIS